MLGIENPVHFDVGAAREAGFRDVVAPPMFAVVYSAPALAPAMFDPEVGMNFATMVHGGQEFEWERAGLLGRRDHHHREMLSRSTRRTARASTSLSPLRSTGTASRWCAASGPTSSGGCEMADLKVGDADPGAEGDPRQVPAAPLRGRLGGLQPDPHRPRVRQGGRAAGQHPARPLLDGPRRQSQRRASPAAIHGR